MVLFLFAYFHMFNSCELITAVPLGSPQHPWSQTSNVQGFIVRILIYSLAPGQIVRHILWYRRHHGAENVYKKMNYKYNYILMECTWPSNRPRYHRNFLICAKGDGEDHHQFRNRDYKSNLRWNSKLEFQNLP